MMNGLQIYFEHSVFFIFYLEIAAISIQSKEFTTIATLSKISEGHTKPQSNS